MVTKQNKTKQILLKYYSFSFFFLRKKYKTNIRIHVFPESVNPNIWGNPLYSKNKLQIWSVGPCIPTIFKCTTPLNWGK